MVIRKHARAVLLVFKCRSKSSLEHDYALHADREQTHRVGGWDGKDVVNLNHHGCNNTGITAYINVAGERVDLISWDKLQDDIQAEGIRAAAVPEEPNYRTQLHTVFTEFGTNYAAAVKKFLDPSLYVEPANESYDIIKGVEVHGMNMLLFAHGQNKTFSFAFEQTVGAPESYHEHHEPLPLAITALAFIGGMLTDLLGIVNNTNGRYDHLSVYDAITLWAAYEALQHLYKPIMNTLPRPCEKYGDCPPTLVTPNLLDARNMSRVLHDIQAGSFNVHGTPWEA